MYECLSSSGEQLILEEARQMLESIDGKGKAARLAKLILELPPDRWARHRHQVALQMLRTRLERLDRWQGYDRTSDGIPCAASSKAR